MASCASPLEDKHDTDLRRTVRESAAREIAEANQSPDYVVLQREDRTAALQLSLEILAQLEQMAGPVKLPRQRAAPRAGPVRQAPEDRAHHDGAGRRRGRASQPQRRVRPARPRHQPARQYIAADAAFDWVLFSNLQYTGTNEPRVDSFDTVGGVSTGVVTNVQDAADFQLGLRKSLISGGMLTLQTELQYTDNNTFGLVNTPNPAKEANFVIELDQPLLRGFGSDVTLSQVRLARNAELDQISQLKSTLLTNVNDTEGAYWKLVESRADLQILVRLLEEGEEGTSGSSANRRVFDADPATISNAAATVESRCTNVIRAQAACSVPPRTSSKSS